MVPGRGYWFLPAGAAGAGLDVACAARRGDQQRRAQDHTPGHRSDASWTSSIACAVAPGLGRVAGLLAAPERDHSRSP